MRAILGAHFVRSALGTLPLLSTIIHFSIVCRVTDSHNPSVAMKKHLRNLLLKNKKQPQVLGTNDGGPSEAPAGPSTSSPPPAYPVGCETLFEGAVPIVAE
jgi:hypothetical protein